MNEEQRKTLEGMKKVIDECLVSGKPEDYEIAVATIVEMVNSCPEP